MGHASTATARVERAPDGPPVTDDSANHTIPENAPISPPQAVPPVGDGRFHKQYCEHAATTAWGTEKHGCGAGTLIRLKAEHIQLCPILCDTWACKLCGIKRAAWLKREVHRARFRYGLKYFWTLTLSTSRCTAAESFAVITRAWNNLKTDLQREYGRFSYVWIMESTKQGYAHLHLLTSPDIPERELKRLWCHHTQGSYQAKVELVSTDKAANYITKYCAKEAHTRREADSGALRKKHLFGKSRDVRFPCFRCGEFHEEGQKECAKTDDGWHRWPMPYKDAREFLSRELHAETDKLEKTPYAAYKAPESLCSSDGLREWITGLDTDAGAWEEPDPAVDDPLEELPVHLYEMDQFLAAMGIQTQEVRA